MCQLATTALDFFRSLFLIFSQVVAKENVNFVGVKLHFRESFCDLNTFKSMQLDHLFDHLISTMRWSTYFFLKCKQGSERKLNAILISRRRRKCLVKVDKYIVSLHFSFMVTQKARNKKMKKKQNLVFN